MRNLPIGRDRNQLTLNSTGALRSICGATNNLALESNYVTVLSVGIHWVMLQ